MKPQTPLLAVDGIVVYKKGIILIKRKNKPKGFALPGGFVDIGETVENAVKREVFEETGVKVEIERLFNVYSDPFRDERGHCVSIVFVCKPLDENFLPVGGDDAAKAIVFDLKNLPSNLCFDHKKIISDFIKGN
ncbi:MAG: NUDIX hydrolase [Desulforegulaceae bacterium]|nr:NUDIX hydrolase [Desulforegulaceae bacterium]